MFTKTLDKISRKNLWLLPTFQNSTKANFLFFIWNCAVGSIKATIKCSKVNQNLAHRMTTSNQVFFILAPRAIVADERLWVDEVWVTSQRRIRSHSDALQIRNLFDCCCPLISVVLWGKVLCFSSECLLSVMKLFPLTFAF